eukprot:SAG11_NODE_263_length_11526_cov_23.830314_2_plen_68_part_00
MLAKFSRAASAVKAVYTDLVRRALIPVVIKRAREPGRELWTGDPTLSNTTRYVYCFQYFIISVLSLA